MNSYQGGFPHGLLDKLNRDYGIYQKKTLFPFGGSTEQRSNWTINDINEDLDVDKHHDARDLPEHWENKFEVVVSDPPYSEEYAEEYYDTDYPRPKSHFTEAVRVLQPGGYLIILDWLCYENYCPNKVEREGIYKVTSGPKQRIRALNVFRKFQTLSQVKRTTPNNED